MAYKALEIGKSKCQPETRKEHSLLRQMITKPDAIEGALCRATPNKKSYIPVDETPLRLGQVRSGLNSHSDNPGTSTF